jgi:hypothetical protein
MKSILFTLLFFILFIFISACNTGYNRHNGNWVWTTHDEYNGRRHNPIFGADNSSFKVLANDNFAADKISVYYQGRKIKHAQPESFTPLTHNHFGYAKDNSHVFFETEVILKADPATFEVLAFPYARDKNDVYNGTLPMNLAKDEVATFTVTNENKLFSGSVSTIRVEYFIEDSPEYSWIKEYDPELKHVILGNWGTGKTSNRKFKGLKEIK